MTLFISSCPNTDNMHLFMKQLIAYIFCVDHAHTHIIYRYLRYEWKVDRYQGFGCDARRKDINLNQIFRMQVMKIHFYKVVSNSAVRSDLNRLHLVKIALISETWFAILRGSTYKTSCVHELNAISVFKVCVKLVWGTETDWNVVGSFDPRFLFERRAFRVGQYRPWHFFVPPYSICAVRANKRIIKSPLIGPM